MTQEQVTYFATPKVREFTPDRFPVVDLARREPVLGFPVYGEVAVKAGRDGGGDVVTADKRRYDTDQARAEDLRRFLETYLPAAVGPELSTKTCLYTLPPDRDFILDPARPPRIALASARATRQVRAASSDASSPSSRSTETLRFTRSRRSLIDRPALTDPDFVPTFRLKGTAAASTGD